MVGIAESRGTCNQGLELLYDPAGGKMYANFVDAVERICFIIHSI